MKFYCCLCIIEILGVYLVPKHFYTDITIITGNVNPLLKCVLTINCVDGLMHDFLLLFLTDPGVADKFWVLPHNLVSQCPAD